MGLRRVWEMVWQRRRLQPEDTTPRTLAEANDRLSQAANVVAQWLLRRESSATASPITSSGRCGAGGSRRPGPDKSRPEK